MSRGCGSIASAAIRRRRRKTDLAPRWRLSPAFTWFPTEYSKLRLQYNFDRSNDFRGDEQSLWLQVEFLLGAHAAHKF